MNNFDEAKKWVAEGDKYLENFDFGKAIECFTKAIEFNQNYAEAYSNRSRAYVMKGDCDKAIEDCIKAIKLKPDYAEAYGNRGNAYFVKGDYDRAIEDYNKAIELKPDYAKAYSNRGNTYLVKGDYDKAIEDCIKAIELKPYFAEAYINRGATYNAKQDYERAIKDFAKAIELKPSFAKAYFSRGTVYFNKDDYDKAIEDCTKAIELDSKYVDAYCSRGNAYLVKGDYDKAIVDYTKAIKLVPNLALAYNNRSSAYYDKGDYDKAIEDCTKAIDFEQKNVKAYINRGNAYSKKGDYDKGIADYTKAIEFDSEYESAYYNRGLTYSKKGDYDTAFDDFKKALKLGNKRLNVYFFIPIFINVKDPGELFKKLTEINEIWENENVYKFIIPEGAETQETKKLWFYQYILLYILSLKDGTDNKIDIASYISVATLKNLIGLNEKKILSEFRLTSITEANDTEEGNILLKLLEKNDSEIDCCKEDMNNKYELTALQASFTRKKDSLNMFRLYGKNSDKEATGACMVFKNSFFNTENDTYMPIAQVIPQPLIGDKKTGRYEISEKENDNKKLPLYYVLYYNKNTNKLIYNPTDSEYDNIVISLEKEDIAKLNEKGIVWKQSPDSIDKEVITRKIQFVFKHIIKLVKEIIKVNPDNSEFVYMLLINLHYLIKDEAFLEETELRLLEIMKYDNKTLRMDLNINRVYKEYLPVIENNALYHVNEIILGNKIEGAKSFAETLNIFFKETDIKASVSKSPLR